MPGSWRSCRHPRSATWRRATRITMSFDFVFRKLNRSTSGRSFQKKLLLKRKVDHDGECFGARFYAGGVVGDDSGNWGAGRAAPAGAGRRDREGETGYVLQCHASMGGWEPALCARQ